MFLLVTFVIMKNCEQNMGLLERCLNFDLSVSLRLVFYSYRFTSANKHSAVSDFCCL